LEDQEFYEQVAVEDGFFGVQMPPTDRHSQMPISIAEGEQPAQERISHLAALRAARAQHQAIARGLQLYFDAVTTEQVPRSFLEILEQQSQSA